MLQPLTRAKFEQLIPKIATSAQYSHYWGKWQDLVNRLLVSVVAVVVVLLLGLVLPGALTLLFGTMAGFYWLWQPVYRASLRNAQARKIRYSGFWRSRVAEVFLTEELLGEEETVDRRGELVVVENRERRINLVLEDRTGFYLTIQAPLLRIHKNIRVGQTAELLLLSNREDLSTIEKISDAYIPDVNLWIGMYPWLQRDEFIAVSRQLGSQSRDRARPPRQRRYTNAPRPQNRQNRPRKRRRSR